MSAVANPNAPAAPAPDLVKLLALAERVSGLETCGGLGPGMLLSSLVAEAREALDSNGGAADAAPKRAITFDQLPLASCSLSIEERAKWLNVLDPLIHYAGRPGDWGRESKLGVLTMRIMQARAEIVATEGREP